MIPEIFHSPLSLDPTYTLHISPFNIVPNMHRLGQDKIPAFLQCGRNFKLGKIFGLTLPDLNPHISNFFNLNTHYLYSKLIELGAEYLSPRVLTADSISEVSQYDFEINKLTVTPKHFKLTKKRIRLLWNRKPGKYLQPLQYSKHNVSSQDNRNRINCLQTSQSQK